MIMSAIWTGEKFKTVDIIFLVVSLIGVTAITYGFSYGKNGIDSNSDFLVGLAVIGAFMIPILTAYSNIITRKMKGMHENTISCYINPSIGIFSLVIIAFRWEFEQFN